MFLNIYNMVVEVLGVLPVELEWLYGLGTIIVFYLILSVIFFPFTFMYSCMFGGKR